MCAVLIVGLLPPIRGEDLFLEHTCVQQTYGGSRCSLCCWKQVQMAPRS